MPGDRRDTVLDDLWNALYASCGVGPCSAAARLGLASESDSIRYV